MTTEKTSRPGSPRRPTGRTLALATLGVAVAVFGAVAPHVAGQGKPGEAKSGYYPPFKLGRPAPGTNQWVNWAWTGDERPYRAASDQVRADMARQGPRPVVAAYQAAAYAAPADPLAQYLWAYAAQAGAARDPKLEPVAGQALIALQGVDPGNVRAYARLRYYMTVTFEPNKAHPEIERVGDRLLQINPHDKGIRKAMIYDLCNGRGVHKAIRLAKAWVTGAPNDADAHATLAYVYQNLWFADKSPATKRLAIGEYRRFLALATPQDAFRHEATRLIGVLQKEKI